MSAMASEPIAPDAQWDDFPEARMMRAQNEPQRFEILVITN